MRRFRLYVAALLLALGLPGVLGQDNTTDDGATEDEGAVVGDFQVPDRIVRIDANAILIAVAATIGLGFIGFLAFDRFKIADTLALIGLGIVMATFGLLDVELFRDFQPLVAGFALLIIMLDAGLDLRFGELAQGMGWGIVFSVLGFALTVSFVGSVTHFFLDLPWVLALILACAMVDTAGIIILPIVQKLGLPGRVKTALLVETSLPDVMTITLALVLIDTAAGEVSPSVGVGTQVGQILSGFALTLLIGLFAGLFWIRALGWLAKRRYVYMTTLAAVLALNWGVGALDGSGPIAVLAFGLVIGNRALFGKWSRGGPPKVFADMTQFNGEVAFLVRSFFFVYLGLILDVSALTLAFILGALLIFVAIMAARATAVWLMTVKSKAMRPYRKLLLATIPRGMTAAVVSTLPATRGIGGTEAFVAYAVVVIIVTNLIFTVGLFLFFRGAAGPAAEDDDAGARAA